MKTTRTLAWTALAGLLVIGPLTMTRAHDFPWPGPFSHPLLGTSVAPMGSSVAKSSGSYMSVNLKAEGLSASALSEALVTSQDQFGEFEFKRVSGLADYIVVVIPGSDEAPLIQIDVQERPKVLGHLHRICDGLSGGVIYCPKAVDRPTTFVFTGDFEAGLTPQAALSAATAGALLLAAGAQL